MLLHILSIDIVHINTLTLDFEDVGDFSEIHFYNDLCYF